MLEIKNQKGELTKDIIDILFLAKTAYTKRKFIGKIVIIFIALGLFITFLLPSKGYKAYTTFLVKTSNTSAGSAGLGGLAALAGISMPAMGGSITEIPPSLYPNVISSIRFKRALIHVPIQVEGFQKEITYAEYFENVVQLNRLEVVKKYTLGLPSLVLGKLRPPTIVQNEEEVSDFVRLSPQEQQHFSRLKNQLKVEFEEGVLTLSFSMPEPLIAAQMAQFAFDLLQREVIAFQLTSSMEELKSTQSLYEEKKEEFEKAQRDLGYFRDRNQNVITATAQNQQERLQAEYNLKFSVFSEIAKNLENTKIQIAKDTPIFSIIDPVTIPNSMEAKRSTLILLIFIVLGLFVAVLFVFGAELLKSVREQWGEEKVNY